MHLKFKVFVTFVGKFAHVTGGLQARHGHLGAARLQVHPQGAPTSSSIPLTPAWPTLIGQTLLGGPWVVSLTEGLATWLGDSANSPELPAVTCHLS